MMPLKDCEFYKEGGTAFDSLESAFEIQRSLPHGHVAAVLGTLKNIGLESLISDLPSRQRDLVTAMIVARIIDPASKLAQQTRTIDRYL
ncbi:hypothetical protein [Microcoleus sp. F4-D5]|uniref:hypothetical protein n=1 Tax=Microcoleus sp. F4-D5 TaxID=2818760 RepID=UPI002FD41B6B